MYAHKTHPIIKLGEKKYYMPFYGVECVSYERFFDEIYKTQNFHDLGNVTGDANGQSKHIENHAAF